MPNIPEDWPVQPLNADEALLRLDTVECGTCGLHWADSIPTELTPAPSARCPFEAFHDDDETEGTDLVGDLDEHAGALAELAGDLLGAIGDVVDRSAVRGALLRAVQELRDAIDIVEGRR